MGLDMYLNKRTYIGAEYEHRKVKGKIEITEGEEDKPINIQFNRVSEIIERVAYWRKANQIHKCLLIMYRRERMIAVSTTFLLKN